MLDGEYDNYWTNTASYESVQDYIAMNYYGLKDAGDTGDSKVRQVIESNMEPLIE